MKKYLSVSALAILLSTTTLFATETEKQQNKTTTDTALFATETEKQQNKTVTIQTHTVQAHSDNNFYNMGRGVVNITTCWMELFRCMVYRNSEVPFWGFVAGTVEGAGLTGMRAFGGVTDVMFLGFDIGSIYNDKFQDFVWNSRWIPKSSLQNARKAMAN